MASSRPDAEMTAYIERYLSFSGLSTASSIDAQRADYDALVQRFRHPRPDNVTSRDTALRGRHGDIPLRYYRSGNDATGTLVMFIHGGGFVLGNLDTHDDICADLCAGTGFELVSVDYRLSPEYAHPVHLDDVEDAFIALEHERVILVGASAGGTLAAALCHRLRGSPSQPLGQVLIYPSLGGDCFDLDSYRDNAQAPLLSTADIAFYRGARCADGQIPLEDPEFYPLVANDFSGLPPTVAFSADIDPLRDDSAVYVERLNAAGGQARWINEPGLVHDYLRARYASRVAGEAFARICAAVKSLV